MNDFPLIEMLAFFTRFETKPDADWRLPYRRDLLRVRSCHSKEKGGISKSYYTIDTKQGEIFDLVFNEQELLWSLDKTNGYENMAVDRVLVFVDRHKHKPSRAHRLIPYRFELLPEEMAKIIYDGTEKPLIHRMQPYRYRSGKITSTQVVGISTRHLENIMITKELNYVVETDQHRFIHLVYILDEMDWRFMQEIDEQYLILR